MANVVEKMSKKNLFLNGLWVTLGALLMSFTISAILLPYNIIDGGVTGISMIISNLTGFSLGVLIFLINIPFVYLGYKKLGKIFTILTVYGIAALSLFTVLFHDSGFKIEDIDTFLAAVVGGVGLGVGVGLVLKYGGALDGIDCLAVILSKKFNISVGNVIMIANVFIFAASAFVYDLSTAFYSMITYYIAKTVIDLVVDGTNESKTFMISSLKIEQIGEAISEELNLNFTYFKAIGSFTKEDTKMLYVAVNRLEEAKLKRIINSIDKNAFYVIGMAQEYRTARRVV